MSNVEYQEFMVYELEDSGDRVRLDLKQDDLQKALHEEQVLVIVREDLRKIYIWKGSKSPVRKRFISSKIAGQLQEELVKSAGFHRCKIVSIDQGEELEEFLQTFKLESMKVTETLQEMRYVRNIDKDPNAVHGKVLEERPKKTEPTESNPPKESPKEVKGEPERTLLNPDELKEEIEGGDVKIEKPKVQEKPKSAPKKQEPKKTEEIRRKVEASSLDSLDTGRSGTSIKSNPAPHPIPNASEEELKKIKEKILANEVPSNYRRQNLILGSTLYASVSKKVNVFGKINEEVDWEAVKSVPKGMVELDNHKIRVYFNDEKGFVEAIEMLDCIEPSKNTEQKKKPEKPKKEDIKSEDSKKPEEPKKVEPKEAKSPQKQGEKKEEKPAQPSRRQLPKIPNESGEKQEDKSP